MSNPADDLKVEPSSFAEAAEQIQVGCEWLASRVGALEAENVKLKIANKRLTNWILENSGPGVQVYTDTGMVVT